MGNLIKIGTFAILNNLSVQTLRYYEEIQLLQPAYVDPFTHYRYYDLLQCPIIDSIQSLKECGFSLNDIKEFLHESNNNRYMVEKLTKKKTSLLNEKEKIEKQINDVDNFITNHLLYEKSLSHDHFELLRLPKRYIYTFKVDKNIYTMTPTEYELSLRHFKQHIESLGLPLLSFSHVGSITTHHDFIANQLFSDTLFVFCPAQLKHLPHVHVLRDQHYAVDYCYSFEDEIKQFPSFKESLEQKGLTPSGDYLCEVIREIPLSTELKRNMCIKMQIPVH